eukprot:7387556-Prymnesium_polylepis.3
MFWVWLIDVLSATWCRAGDSALMMLIELALVLVYTCVLVIKSCDMSAVQSSDLDAQQELAAVVCTTYGLGTSAKGVYLFFVFFGLAMLVVQLFIGAAQLYVAGNAPTLILAARAHGSSPTEIVKKVVARRCEE